MRYKIGASLGWTDEQTAEAIPGDVQEQGGAEAIKGVRTVNEIATHYGVYPTQVAQWKKQALDHGREAFSDGRKRHERAEAELQSELYQQIGQRKVGLRGSCAPRLKTAPDTILFKPFFCPTIGERLS